MDTSHKGLCRSPFFLGSFCVPRTAAKDFLGTVKRRNVVFGASMVFFTNVQPLLAPPLNGVREFDVEVVDRGANRNNNAAYIIGDIGRAITATEENALP